MGTIGVVSMSNVSCSVPPARHRERHNSGAGREKEPGYGLPANTPKLLTSHSASLILSSHFSEFIASANYELDRDHEMGTYFHQGAVLCPTARRYFQR
jgi:hypothetical protein